MRMHELPQKHHLSCELFYWPPKSPGMNTIGMSYYMLFRKDLHYLTLLWICGLAFEIHGGNFMKYISSITNQSHSTLIVAALLLDRCGPTRY
ncbi:hypothetical protein TNCT_172671 [Trichonephila clavata]|uniref:Uncharacterized protein n=1 Tax=Trichonephila clavata TaxID=2740835 RepID=A0A8X6G487_TRICU|nr:hypothetical protein TNCT_172671 [Trichonephila clavata]